MNRRALAALAALVLVACAPRAWSAEARSISTPMGAAAKDTIRDPGARRHLAFSPAPLERCDSYLILESAAAQVNIDANDWLDNHLVRNSFGVMRNVSDRASVGGSLDLYWLEGTVAAAPSVRARRWFGRRQSVEGAAGWVFNQRDGATGPIGTLRYSPVPAVFVEGGVCRMAAESFEWNLNSPYFGYRYTKSTRGFGGVGLAGGGGVVVWAAEAVAIIGVGIMLVGMGD